MQLSVVQRLLPGLKVFAGVRNKTFSCCEGRSFRKVSANMVAFATNTLSYYAVYIHVDALCKLPSTSNNSNYYVFVFENEYKVS